MKTDLISRLFGLLALALCSATVSQAHPGHEMLDSSVTHVVSSPYHLLTLALLGGGCLVATRFIASARARKLVAATGCLLIASGILTQLL